MCSPAANGVIIVSVHAPWRSLVGASAEERDIFVLSPVLYTCTLPKPYAGMRTGAVECIWFHCSVSCLWLRPGRWLLR